MGGDRYKNGFGEGTIIVQRLIEARQIAQPKGSSPSITDIPYRALSIYLSVFFARFDVSPNKITVIWVFLGLIGDVGLGSSNFWVRATAAAAFQISYLLDYVDGEVARLEHRVSKRGLLLDLIGHSLIKSGIFLGVGFHTALARAKVEYLIFGFLASVSVANLSLLHTMATYAGVSTRKIQNLSFPAPHPARASILRRAVPLFGLLFESAVVYGFVLVTAVSDSFVELLLFYGICGPIWFAFRLKGYKYE